MLWAPHSCKIAVFPIPTPPATQVASPNLCPYITSVTVGQGYDNPITGATTPFDMACATVTTPSIGGFLAFHKTKSTKVWCSPSKSAWLASLILET
jgi:hypothetical protein